MRSFADFLVEKQKIAIFFGTHKKGQSPTKMLARSHPTSVKPSRMLLNPFDGIHVSGAILHKPPKRKKSGIIGE